ncbi:MAG: hypothetical protein ACI9TH_001018 [Kiritimatiellia bacterium]|jgi:hypothetical protein
MKQLLLTTFLLTACVSSTQADLMAFRDGVNGYDHLMRQVRKANLGSSGSTSAVGSFGGDAHLHSLSSFDLSAIPNNAIIQQVSLQLVVQNTDSTAGTFEGVELHAVTNPNTLEITSPGGTDVTTGTTWTNVRTGIPWNIPGGDYDPTPLAFVSNILHGNMNQAFDDNELFTFQSTPAFVSAVQGALSQNRPFQFLLASFEQEQNNDRRFVRWKTDLATLEADRPLLSITYTQIPEPKSGILFLIGVIGLKKRMRLKRLSPSPGRR